jgi:hypothetical protein
MFHPGCHNEGSGSEHITTLEKHFLMVCRSTYFGDLGKLLVNILATMSLCASASIQTKTPAGAPHVPTNPYAYGSGTYTDGHVIWRILAPPILSLGPGSTHG